MAKGFFDLKNIRNPDLPSILKIHFKLFGLKKYRKKAPSMGFLSQYTPCEREFFIL